jgi:hypothetical protein
VEPVKLGGVNHSAITAFHPSAITTSGPALAMKGDGGGGDLTNPFATAQTEQDRTNANETKKQHAGRPARGNGWAII